MPDIADKEELHNQLHPTALPLFARFTGFVNDLLYLNFITKLLLTILFTCSSSSLSEHFYFFQWLLPQEPIILAPTINSASSYYPISEVAPY